MPPDAFYRLTELDRTTWPELRDRIARFNPDEPHPLPRRYPGYPRIDLPSVKPRLWPSLDRMLLARRCARTLSTDLPDRKRLSRLLHFAHGGHDKLNRGPTPSSGGLQALELFLVNLTPGWLQAGIFHYDRQGHDLAEIAPGADRSQWQTLIPSLPLVTGGALLWILVGDAARVTAKYGPRGYRFLLLEAGHLMQNLCLLSTSMDLSTVPLGGFLEGDIAQALSLPDTDVVLYTGCCGTAR